MDTQEKRLLRKKRDGGYEAIAFGPGGARYDPSLSEAAAKEMWAKGGYDELDEDAADFEAARLIAGVDTSGGVPKRISVRRQVDGDDDPGNDQFQIEREFPNGLKVGQAGSRSLVNAARNLGGERVLLEPDLPAPEANDAKLDGFSNPAARPAQDWRDGPRNPSPMPRAGMKPAQPRPGIQVGLPGQGGGGYAERVKAEATRQPVSPGMDRLEKQSPQVAAYMLQRMDAQDPYAEARRQASGNRFGVQLARAGSMANQALSGARMDTRAWDDLEQNSQQPMEDFAARRGMAREDAAEQRALGADARAQAAEGRASAEGQREADLYDPASSRSRQARSMLMLRFRPQVARMSPEEFRNLSAADVAELARGFAADRDDEMAAQRHREDLAARNADRAEARNARLFQQEESARARAEAAKAKEVQMRERQDEKDLAELGKRTDKLAQTQADVETINRMLSEGGDIPGAGVWDSVKMTNAVTRALFASKDDVGSWQASQRMAANYLNQMTGQSFTPLEAERTLQRYGVAPGATEQEWTTGMQAFIRDVKAGLIQKQAPFQHVVPEMRARGGITAEDIPEPASRPTGETIRMEDGSVWEVMDNGKARRVR